MYNCAASIASSRDLIARARRVFLALDQPSGRGAPLSVKHEKPCEQPHPVADGDAALSIHLLAVSLLSRFAARAGFVTQRQRFVRRCHGGMAWPKAIITLRQEARV
jgi:hypothetical protein